MGELVDRFRAFAQARAVAASQPRPDPPEPRRPSSWPEGFAPVSGSQGTVLGRRTLVPLAVSESSGPWAERLARASLGPCSGWRFLDLETTGLSRGAGTRAFLVGLGTAEGDQLRIEQYLLPDLDPESERALWGSVREELTKAQALVSFNGKAFDWPLVRDRFILSGLGDPPTLAHWDVLPAARRLWASLLGGSCDLRRLEAEVLGQGRGPDVAGADIPALYVAWLDGDRSALDGVLRHHLEDLRALAGVALALEGALADGLPATAPAALWWGLGRLREQAGEAEAAVGAYLRSRAGGWREAGPAAARLLKRLGRHEEAAAIWEAERRGPIPSLEAAEELAKHLEHRVRDPLRALGVVEDALPWAVRAGGPRRGALERRMTRLRAKVERRRGGQDHGPAAAPRVGP